MLQPILQVFSSIRTPKRMPAKPHPFSERLRPECLVIEAEHENKSTLFRRIKMTPRIAFISKPEDMEAARAKPW
jgi:hypothetical protein